MPFYMEKQSTTSTPYLLIDEEKNYMKMEGKSFHENIVAFFKEINDWMDSYLTSDFELFTFDCAMDYFNSSTIKALLNIVKKLDKHCIGNKKIIINWITTDDNEIIIECGEDYLDDVHHLEFNMIINPSD